MRPVSLIASVFLFAAATTAWPTGWGVSDRARRELAPPLEMRADQTTANTKNTPKLPASSSPAASSSKNKSNGKASGSGSGSSIVKGGKSTAKTTGKSTGKHQGQTTRYESTKTFDDRLPAGGLSLITPAPLSGSQYYRVSDWVTFAWNYTSLSITPQAVDVIASCSVNQATYTIATNQSITGPSQTVLWDTGAFEQTNSIPLVVATYTLIIYDAASSPGAQAQAGYLGTFEDYTFGMYTGQPYTPRSDFVCATCNGAISSIERHTIGFLLGMAAMTVLSFGWFAGVAGIW